MNQYHVYILANERPSVYVGMTSDIIGRVYKHKMGIYDGFTKRYKIHKLVYIEETNDAHAALAREKQLKNWHREWKLRLVRDSNPEFRDLYGDILADYGSMDDDAILNSRSAYIQAAFSSGLPLRDVNKLRFEKENQAEPAFLEEIHCSESTISDPEDIV